MTRSVRRIVMWAPLAACVVGALVAFATLDPAMRPGDPAMIPIEGRAAALREAQAWYRLALTGAAAALLWAMGVKLFTPRAADDAAE